MIDRNNYLVEMLDGITTVEDEGSTSDVYSPKLLWELQATEGSIARTAKGGRSENLDVARARAEAARLSALRLGR